MSIITKRKEALENELARLTKDLAELGIHNPEITEDWIATPGEIIDSEPDKNIAADRSEDWQGRRATVAVLESRYNNIVRALQKMTDSHYGICEICNNPIEEKRLNTNPAARTCTLHLNEEKELSQ